MPSVHLAIGSNLGRREENCLRAVELLKERGVRVVKQSSLHETEPWGNTDQPGFINMAVEVETDLSPGDLLRNLKEIEASLGRTEGRRWGPRIIDLDILFYSDLVVHSPGLEIPHPGIREREFVLMPLSEIAPDKIHPLLGKSVEELLSETRRT